MLKLVKNDHYPLVLLNSNITLIDFKTNFLEKL